MCVCMYTYIPPKPYRFHQRSRKTFADWKQIGTFVAPPGKSQCTDCRAGYYQAAVASTSCLQCESGVVPEAVRARPCWPHWGQPPSPPAEALAAIQAMLLHLALILEEWATNSHSSGRTPNMTRESPCSQSVSIGQSQMVGLPKGRSILFEVGMLHVIGLRNALLEAMQCRQQTRAPPVPPAAMVSDWAQVGQLLLGFNRCQAILILFEV